MKIDIISAVPQLMESFFSHSILKRAKEKQLLEVNIFNLRNYTNYKHGQIDDYQFGRRGRFGYSYWQRHYG